MPYILATIFTYFLLTRLSLTSVYASWHEGSNLLVRDYPDLESLLLTRDEDDQLHARDIFYDELLRREIEHERLIRRMLTPQEVDKSVKTLEEESETWRKGVEAIRKFNVEEYGKEHGDSPRLEKAAHGLSTQMMLDSTANKNAFMMQHKAITDGYFKEVKKLEKAGRGPEAARLKKSTKEWDKLYQKQMTEIEKYAKNRLQKASSSQASSKKGGSSGAGTSKQAGVKKGGDSEAGTGKEAGGSSDTGESSKAPGGSKPGGSRKSSK